MILGDLGAVVTVETIETGSPPAAPPPQQAPTFRLPAQPRRPAGYVYSARPSSIPLPVPVLGQSDWPLPPPRGKLRPAGFVYTLDLAVQPVVAPPATPIGWAQPVPRRLPLAERGHLWSARPSAIPIPGTPTEPPPWPLPRGAVFPIGLHGFVWTPFAGSITVQAPPPNVLWPRPRGAAFPLALHGFVSFPNAGIVPVPTSPMPARPGYPPAPLGPIQPMFQGDVASSIWVRRVVDVVNGSLGGRLNVGLGITLTANSTTTTVTDARIGFYSALLLCPTSADAAAIQGSVYVSSQQSGQATLTHLSTAETDCTFTLVIIG